VKKATRGDRVIAFIESFCKAPEGAHVGQPLRLLPFQKDFIREVYDNPAGTRRGYLSIARKNGKTALIAGILLAHIAGPEARQNSQIISGAMSRDQAALVFDLACKMIRMNQQLAERTRIVPSSKRIVGLARNVEYRAISAEGRTAHGLSPVLAILDEIGQVRGAADEFIDAIVTSQGAHEAPLLLAISTQAPNDADLFSIWLDDARASKDARIVCHLYEADKTAPLDDRKGWKAANPALGKFRSLEDVVEQADRAQRMPAFEPTFRNLVLNQRVELVSPFISKGVWTLNSAEIDESAFLEEDVFVGIDLSGRSDLTSIVAVARRDGRWHVKAYFWTPEKGLRERARADRAPYDVWHQQGLLRTTPGASVDYTEVVRELADIVADWRIVAAAFDRWRFDLFQKELDQAGLALPLVPFGQGFKDMSPAIDALESELLNERVAHGGHPVLTMCAANARVERDAAGNRKLSKHKATGRIDGMVALAMAIGAAQKTIDREGSLDDFLASPVIG
jgi:phage terminase large subunit-like protein